MKNRLNATREIKTERGSANAPGRFLLPAPVGSSAFARVWIVVLILPFLSVTTALALPLEPNSGDPEKGHVVFHGKGICYYCHGHNGNPENLPDLKPETLRTIRGLRPEPPDLRRPKELKLKSDRQRFVIIRNGHEGTGMFPDTTLSNQEIRDVVAYLETLRAPTKQRSKQ
jgi:mono/diheme cytochrome c family protein